MSPAGRRALNIAVRLVGLALVVVVFTTQVKWKDAIVLKDGTTLKGTVEEVVDGYRMQDESGAVRLVPAADVQIKSYGGRDIPSVSYGFPTLVQRLSGSLGTVAAVLVALFGLVLLTAWRWRWLVLALGLPLFPREAIRYTLYGVFFNLVVPGSTGGDVVKAYYAAQRTKVPTKAVVSVFVDRLVGLFALVLFAAMFLFFGPSREGFGQAKALVAGVLGAAVIGGVLVLSSRVRRALGIVALLRRLPFQGVLKEIDAAIRLYRRHPGSLGLGFLVSFFNHAGNATCVFLLARALGLSEIRLTDVFPLVSVIGLLCAIPLLPGGWGVGELAFAYFFGQIGVAPSEAVGLSVVWRLANLTVSLPGGALWMLSRDHVKRSQMAETVHRAEAEVGVDASTVPESLPKTLPEPMPEKGSP